MIHQSKDQGDVPTLVGQPLEAAEVWDGFIKPVGIKIRLRPGHSPPMAFGQEGRKTEVRDTRILASGSAFCRHHGFDKCFRRAQSRGKAGVGSHHS